MGSEELENLLGIARDILEIAHNRARAESSLSLQYIVGARQDVSRALAVATGTRGSIKHEQTSLSFPRVPEGRYAIMLTDDTKLHFYRIEHSRSEGWKGFMFVHEIVGSAECPVKEAYRKSAVLIAIAENPREALFRYGREIGVCGVCGSPLTDPESRANGIGPVCAQKYMHA